MPERRIGVIEHFFPRSNAAVVRLSGDLHVGDRIHIVGHTTDLTEKVRRIELDHRPVPEAHRGQEIGLEVDGRVREHDQVFLT